MLCSNPRFASRMLKIRVKPNLNTLSRGYSVSWWLVQTKTHWPGTIVTYLTWLCHYQPLTVGIVRITCRVIRWSEWASWICHNTRSSICRARHHVSDGNVITVAMTRADKNQLYTSHNFTSQCRLMVQEDIQHVAKLHKLHFISWYILISLKCKWIKPLLL